jgi:hypothetical protein
MHALKSPLLGERRLWNGLSSQLKRVEAQLVAAVRLL